MGDSSRSLRRSPGSGTRPRRDRRPSYFRGDRDCRSETGERGEGPGPFLRVSGPLCPEEGMRSDCNVRPPKTFRNERKGLGGQFSQVTREEGTVSSGLGP